MTTILQADGFEDCATIEDLSEFTVLIVDDSPLNLDVAVACLESRGYRTLSAENGMQALQIAEQSQPSLILLDVMMPEMNGFETCRKLKRLDGCDDIPVIFMTALSDVKSKKAGFDAGGVDYVTKPFQVEELAARVHTHIALKVAYQQLKDSEQRYRKLVETTPDAILVEGEDGIVFLNSAAVGMLKADNPDKLLGGALLDFVTDDQKEYAAMQLKQACSADRSAGPPEVMLLRQLTGGRVEVEVNCIPITYHRSPSHMFVLRDITERRRQEAAIEFQATHDALTGLPNRSLFLDRVTQSINHAQRNESRLALIFIDLDKFKLINDTLGHNAGDELLRIMSKRLQDCTRSCDTLARFGGDEFVLLVDNLESEGDLTHLASRLISSVSAPVLLLGQSHSITCSLGISSFPEDGDNVEVLMRHADIAMYRAKESGRNAYQFFTHQMQDRLNERLKLESSLKQALDNDEFVLHYQPQVDLSTGKIIGLEALIRWQSPTLGLVPPGDFIPAAEEGRLISAIGEWVIFAVCKRLESWRRQGLKIVPVAINISALQFMEQKTEELVKQALNKYMVEPKYLELELTESLSMLDPITSISLMQRLKDIGVSLSIDDFGTGYSNLSYLKRFPVNKLKIDKSFVSGLTNNPDDYSIVKAIIRMSQSLGLKTIAEGAETAGQIALLAAENCDAIQGFYFSRPLPEEQICAMLKERPRLDISEFGRSRDRGAVLVVDDDANILRSIKRILRDEAYEVLVASNTEDAYEVLARREVAVIVSDLQMPGESGVQFFSKIKTMHPRSLRILLTGHGSSESLERAINQGEIYRYISKPWDNTHLLDTLSAAFKQYEKGVG
ncbi:EAL domain-containing protein [Hahella sp. NBU794]|uniref:EAL domain-containing protein n=1 Tax=Hahella sp. NBU794 TaxID=3422590 RepID=UPI003D6F79AB